MTEPRLEHQTVKVKQLISDYRSGKIMIPEFQREYVWRKNKAPKLIDSLYRGFPISSLLVWQSIEEVRSRRNHMSRGSAASANWLIDGQQRMITLSKTFSGDDNIRVMFNPTEDQFSLSNAAIRNNRDWYPVDELWDDELYRRVRRNLDSSGNGDRQEASFDRVRAILDYEIPLVRMVNHSFDNAVQAFERINTLGVKLKKADIASAQVASRHTGFIADEVAPFLEKIHNEGFDRLSIMHLFRACAFIAKPDGRSRTPLHELDKPFVLKAWKDTRKATERAISLIRSELGLVNMDILWSGAFLVPIIAVCAITSPRERDSQGLAGWLALAALHHRYSGASETALDADLRACRDADPIGALLKNLRQRRPSLAALPTDFSGSLADRSGILALYIACKHRGITDFFTGERILLQKNIDRHHILPRGQFLEHVRSSADTIANMAFITSDVNRSIGLTGPEVYLKTVSQRALKSQCVPINRELWTIEAAEGFWDARRKLLAESFNDFVWQAMPNRRI